jgi:hypothetical protein
MRRAAGVVVLALVCAFALPMLLANPAAAFTNPTLTSTGSNAGGPGTAVSYAYSFDTADCGVSSDSLEIDLYWDSPFEQIGRGDDVQRQCERGGSVQHHERQQPRPYGDPVRQHHRDAGRKQRGLRFSCLHRHPRADTYANTDPDP